MNNKNTQIDDGRYMATGCCLYCGYTVTREMPEAALFVSSKVIEHRKVAHRNRLFLLGGQNAGSPLERTKTQKQSEVL